MKKIALVGECMVELISGSEGSLTGFGGDTLNTALYLARLVKEQDIRVSYVSRLGDDVYGQKMLSAWKDEGIDCSLVEQMPDRNTGSYKIDVDETGERSFTYDRSHSPARELFTTGAARLRDVLRQYDALYVSGITLAVLYPEGRLRLLNLMETMKLEGKSIYYDTNHRPSLWESVETAFSTHRKAIELATCLLPSKEDLTSIFNLRSTRSCLEFLKKTAIDEIIFKQGINPLYVLNKGTEKIIEIPVVASPVDTTAAGDSFNAAYIAGRLIGQSPVQAGNKAMELSSIVISYSGSIIPANAMLNCNHPLANGTD